MYCTQCGKQLSDDSLFCSQCGKRVTPPAYQPAPPPPAYQPAPPPSAYQPAPPPPASGFTPQDGPAVWVLRADRKLSVLKQVTCYIVFKQDHLVLAHLSKDMMKTESARMQNEIKAQGIGFFKGSAAMMRGWAAYGDKYGRMTTHDMLAEDPANIAIGYPDITRCLFRGYSTYSSGDDSGDTVVTGKFELTLRGGDSFKFTHRESGSKAIKSTLQSLLGDTLKYKN